MPMIAHPEYGWVDTELLAFLPAVRLAPDDWERTLPGPSSGVLTRYL